MSIWTPTWSIEIDGVEYKDVALSNLTISSGRNDIYTQAIAGYLNLTLINLDDSGINPTINSAVTVYINDSNGDPIALFGGSITDIIIGVQSGGSIGVTQTISITALGALSRLPKVLTEGVLAKELDGEQIYDVLAGILYGSWNEVPAALTWASYSPTTTWANAENSGLGEIDAGNYELTARTADVTDAYSLVAAVGYVVVVVASADAPAIRAAFTAVSVAFAYCAAMLRMSSSMNAGEERSKSSTENV